VNPKLLLLADHDESDRKKLLKALKPFNAKVREAINCEEVHDYICKEDFDCVILDYLLPECDTLSLVKSLREEGISTPIIITTDHGDEMVAVQFLKAGAQDYIPKSKATPKILRDAVSQAMESVKCNTKEDIVVLQNLHQQIEEKIAYYKSAAS